MFTRQLQRIKGPQCRTFSSSVSCQTDFAHVVIGAGAVGLAVARRLALHSNGDLTCIIERHSSVGTETSSRNSEVIHAGIYYGGNEHLKTRLCIKGRKMLYDLCDRHTIPYKRIGKWIVAQDEKQQDQLEQTAVLATSLGVPTEFLSLTSAKLEEPDVLARAAILKSPTTGIVDSHAYMSFLEADFQANDGLLACNTTLKAIRPLPDGQQGWEMEIASKSGMESTVITADSVINCAGLSAIDISNSILPLERRITPVFAKGTYYSYGGKNLSPKTLVYPAPRAGLAGLGTHLTLDLAGQIRFGPDVQWVMDPKDLSVSDSTPLAAVAEIQEYLPAVQVENICPDYCGIRPKLGRGSTLANSKRGDFHDFIIRKEEGLPNFINLLGIESPGLTSSLAIAELVHDLLYR